MRRRRSVRFVALALLMAAAGCSSGGDSDGSSDTTPAGSGSDDPVSSTTVTTAPVEASGPAIVDDGAIEVPGIAGGTAVYELRNVRVTDAGDRVTCPGGEPANAQRLAADLTAYLVPSATPDPNVTRDDEPTPIPYVSQLPEVVLVGVGAEDPASDAWFVGISPQSRILTSTPSTVLRPAPADAGTGCPIQGWEPTDLAEPVGSIEFAAMSTAFVPADFDPSNYQVRLGRGEDVAYCWPLDDLTAPAELGKCR